MAEDQTLRGLGTWFLPILCRMASDQGLDDPLAIADLGNVLLCSLGASVKWTAVPFIFLDSSDGLLTLDDYDALDL